MSIQNIFPVVAQSGNIGASAQPTVTVVDDTNLSKWFCQCAAGSSQYLHFCCPVPPNYVSGGTLRLRWRSPSTTGNITWFCYNVVLANNTGMPSSAPATPSTTTTVAGTANFWNETSINISASLAADTTLHFVVARESGDTAAGIGEWPEFHLEWVVSSAIAQHYLWIPPSAFTIPSASVATKITATVASDNATIKPAVISFPDAASGYVDYSLVLPSNYSGSLLTTLWAATGSNGGAMKFNIDMAKIVVGGSIDPSLTAQTPWSITAGATNHLYEDAVRPAVISPSPLSTVVLRLTRDNTDTNTATVYAYGLLLSWSILAKNPGGVMCIDPQSFELPPANPMALTRWEGTNITGNVLQADDAVTTVAEAEALVSGLYASGGSLKVRWSTPAATGVGKFQVDMASPANGTNSDPALSAGTPFTSATLGANLLNEFTVDVSSGLAAGDVLEIKLTRLGADSGDTLGDLVRIHEVRVESNT